MGIPQGLTVGPFLFNPPKLPRPGVLMPVFAEEDSAASSFLVSPRGQTRRLTLRLYLSKELSSDFSCGQGGAGSPAGETHLCEQPLLFQASGEDKRSLEQQSPSSGLQQGCVHHGLDPCPPRAPLALHRYGQASGTRASSSFTPTLLES